MSAPQDFVELCQRIGARIPLWTQGAGGNVSCKDGDALWIKASGFRLDAVRADAGVARVRLAEFLGKMTVAPAGDEAAESFYASTLASCAETGAGLGRPSMETGFHALLRFRWVAHFHSLPAVLMADEQLRDEQARDRKSLATWLASHTKRRMLFLPAIRPGWLLSRELGKQADAEIVILANHGVILQDDRPLAEARGLLDEWRALETEYCRERGHAELLTLCQGTAPAAAGASAMPGASGPSRIYFPDTAVFIDRIAAVTQAGERAGELRATDDAPMRDRDAAELWAATQYLYRANPKLAELPAEISAVIAGLPTEKFRRGELKS